MIVLNLSNLWPDNYSTCGLIVTPRCGCEVQWVVQVGGIRCLHRHFPGIFIPLECSMTHFLALESLWFPDEKAEPRHYADWRVRISSMLAHADLRDDLAPLYGGSARPGTLHFGEAWLPLRITKESERFPDLRGCKAVLTYRNSD